MSTVKSGRTADDRGWRGAGVPLDRHAERGIARPGRDGAPPAEEPPLPRRIWAVTAQKSPG